MEPNPLKPIDRLDGKPAGRWQNIIKVLLPLLILAVGIAGATYIKKTTPTADRQPPPKRDPLVQVTEIRRTSAPITLQAMGTVIPARELVLKSRVSGEIIAKHAQFIPGGLLKKDDEILQLDSQDYQLAVTQKQSAVADARYALKLELGHQDVAQREWELLAGETPDKALDAELALRKPHLEKARADLAAVEADLRQARLNFARTRIHAPFNALIRNKNVEQGSQVSPQDELAELVGTDAYWVQVSIPVEQLQWITVPRHAQTPGSEVRIRYGNGSHERTGRVIKLLGDLEDQGRLARILVEVKDPLDLTAPAATRPPLLIGEYVRVDIQGRVMDNVIRIPRTALRDDKHVWIAGADGKLTLRQVETLWRDKQTVIIQDGLDEGDRLIVSDLGTPVQGMALRVVAVQDGRADRSSGQDLVLSHPENTIEISRQN